MSKRNPKGNPELKTGNDVINFAEKRGAHIISKGLFWGIKTPQGTMHIKPGHTELDKVTIKNAKRWLKLLGLMVLLVTPATVAYLLLTEQLFIVW